MLNKKGQAGEAVLWIVRIVFLVLPLMGIIAAFIIKFMLALNVVPIEFAILSERAPSCFYPDGVFDLENFGSEELESCFYFADEGAVKIRLNFAGKSMEEETSDFDYLHEISFISGGNVPYKSEFREYILVKDGEELHPGYLDMTLLLKRK